MNIPLVSIIIPVYNSANYLPETIQCTLDQTWPNKEIIIIDDGSTDNSVTVASDYAAKNSEIKLICQENKGAAAARNAGLKVAKGDYIQFLDADDLLSPTKIEKQMGGLAGSQTHLSICHTIFFNDRENPVNGIHYKAWYSVGSDNTVDFLTKLYAGNEVMSGYGGMITVHSWLTPRAVIEKAGLWNENLSVDDDGEFFCRVVLAAEGIIFCEDVFNYYRKFDDQRSLSTQTSRKSIESTITSNDLKFSYLKLKTNESIIDRVFARHYWWTGVLAYPQYKQLSKYCIQKGAQLGYSGEKYIGGPSGKALTKYLGWKAARFIAYYKELLKKRWA